MVAYTPKREVPMVNLIAETNQIQESLIAFYVIMVIIGFVLILVDKRRWIAHTERSAYMMNYKRKRAVAEESTSGSEGEAQEGAEENEEKSKKAKNTKKTKHSPDDYQYEGRIKLGVFLAIGILFGGVGELLGMIFCRHKWYNRGFRYGVPALALFNILIGALLLYLTGETGSPDVINVTVAKIVGSGLCI